MRRNIDPQMLERALGCMQRGDGNNGVSRTVHQHNPRFGDLQMGQLFDLTTPVADT